MIDAILSRRPTLLLSLAFILIAGGYAYWAIPKEAEPDVSMASFYISMPMEGISPEDAERLLIRPMEKELANIEGVKEMTATAAEGSGAVSLQFDAGFDSDKALADIREKIDLVRPELPEDADEPTVNEISMSDMPVIVLTLSGEIPERALTKIAKRLADSIEEIPSVLEARPVGDREEVVEVLIHPSKMEIYQLDQEEILALIARNNRVVAAGNMDTGTGRFSVKVPGLFKNAKDFLELPLKRNGDKIVMLQDVATVHRTFKDRNSYARLNGEPAIAIEIMKRAGENIIDTIDAARSKVEEHRKAWPATVSVTYSQDKSRIIEDMLRDLQNNVLSSVILVMLVVLIALGVRTSILVGIAIPGSFLAGILFLYAMGYTVNMVVLFSLIMAVGMLVDGAIVVTEYADRKMSEGHPKGEAYAEASKRMGMPIIASTLTTLAAFAPLIFWPGMMGEFMKYLPITLIATLSASLFMALIFVPVLGSKIGKPNAFDHGNLEVIEGGHKLDVNKLKGFTGYYARLLVKALPRPGRLILLLLALIALTIIGMDQFGQAPERMPDVEPEFASIVIRGRGNRSIEEVNRLVKQVEDRILDMSELKAIYARADPNLQAFQLPEDAIGQIQFEFIDWENRRKAAVIFDEIQERLSDLAGLRYELKEPEEGPPVGQAVQVRIASQFGDELNSATETIYQKFNEIEGLTNISDTRPEDGFEWEIVVDRAEAAKYGADVALTGNAIQLATNGLMIGDYRPVDSDDEIEIRARYDRSERNLDQLGQIKIATSAGLMPIANFVSQSAQPKIPSINRADKRRVYSVGADLKEGANSIEIVNLLKEWVPDSGIDFSRVVVTFKGQDEEMQAEQRFLTKAFIIALFVITVILLTQFNSAYQAALILTAVVLSTLGVCIGLLLTNQPFGIIMNGIGVISLAGIVVNNNIVLIDTFNHHRKTIADPFDAALLTSVQRLRPVLLTTITTILGLIPMMLGINIDFFTPHISIGAPSTQWWTQLATSVVFGLAFATLLTLVLTPTLLALGENLKFRRKKKVEAQSNTER